MSDWWRHDCRLNVVELPPNVTVCESCGATNPVSAAPVVRCTHRKHLIDNGHEFCDCGSVIVGPTAAGNAKVVTLLGADRVPHTDEADEAPRGNDAIGV